MSFKKTISTNNFRCMVAISTALCMPPIIAAPAIYTVNGDILPGSTVTISGSGFGLKGSAQPFKQDDFENGSLGASPTTQGWELYNTESPVYTNMNSYSGSQSLLRTTPSTRDDFNSAGLKGLNSLQIYYSGWFFWEKVSGTNTHGTPLVKVLRVNSSPAGKTGEFYHGGNGTGASFWITQQPQSPENVWTYAGVVTTSNGTVLTSQQDLTPLTGGKWHRIELYLRLSNPAGATNGEAKVWIDGIQSYNKQGVTRGNSDDGFLLDNFLLPAMIDRGGQVMNYFVDDVYVDRTPQRIELCSSPTWKDCTTNKAIQKIITWSDSKISFEVNLETLPLKEGKLFAYVVDGSNIVNANGYDLLVKRPKLPSNILVK